MYRSASWSKMADDYYMHSTPNAGKEGNEVGAYDPIAAMGKKEKSRFKLSDNAVHFIPLVLFLCGFILWFFSNPDVEAGIRAESVAARIEGLTIEGDIDMDSDGTQTGLLPLDLLESETTKQLKQLTGFRKLANTHQ